VNDPCYDIGGGAPPKGTKVKDPMWYLKSNTNDVIPTHMVCPSKMQRFSLNYLPRVQSFVTMSCTLFQLVSSDLNWYHIPFMEIDDKGGEICTKDMKYGKLVVWTWT